ncbi:MAG: formate dehydrogenase accessory sulfurtransferase FdhD [Acidilobaceae archaeon]
MELVLVEDVDISSFDVIESEVAYGEGDEKHPPIALDDKLDLYINGKLYTTLIMTPIHIEETVLGVLLGDGIVSSLSEVEEVKVDRRDRVVYAQLKKDVELKRSFAEDCALLAVARGSRVKSDLKVIWKTVVDVFLDFNKRTIAIVKGLAMHTSALYDLTGRKIVIAHDTSRHTSIAKLIGLAVTHKVNSENSIVITTGRASSDMVIRSANFGTPIVISTRGPLYSGLSAALLLGVTLISYIRRGETFRGLTVLSYPERIIGYTKSAVY